MQNHHYRSGSRPPLAVAATVALVAALAAACGGSSSGTSSQAGASSAPQSSSSAGSLAGQHLTLMAQGTPEVSKVVEVHAVNLLKDQGVQTDIKYNASATNVAIAQLRAGDVDVYSVGLPAALGAIAAGIPLVDFALGQPRQDYVFVGRPGTSKLSDLKGKKIGVQDTTGINYAQALLVLQKAGISVKDVSIVATGGQTVRLAAVVSGRVDATMLGHNAQLKLAGKGYTTLFDYTKEASNLYDDNFFATKSWLDQHKPLAVALNKALLDSFVWFNDPANADAVVQEALAISPEEDKAKTATLFDLLRKADAYPVGTALDKQALEQQQTLYVTAGIVKKAIPLDQWADTSFAEQAKATG